MINQKQTLLYSILSIISKVPSPMPTLIKKKNAKNTTCQRAITTYTEVIVWITKVCSESGLVQNVTVLRNLYDNHVLNKLAESEIILKYWRIHVDIYRNHPTPREMAYLHWQRRTQERDSGRDSKPNDYIVLCRTFHIAQTWTRIPTPYFCIGQESGSESVSESGNVFKP